MSISPPQRKSGQAIIFLMVVLVVGLLAVIWNFDLHRVISAKLKMRNAGDAAALSAARWQGLTLNMIGDLNLIQAAQLSVSYEEYLEALVAWRASGGSRGPDPRPEFVDYIDYAEMENLHELRARLAFVGPVLAFGVAQQAAFNNGAFRDVELASNLVAEAEDIRYQVGWQPYDNAFKDYADLLDMLAETGVAVSSYSLRLPRHQLVDKKFYAAIAQALSGWWCPFRNYRYLLDHYDGFESWGKLDTEYRRRYMLDLKLDEFTVNTGNWKPDIALPSDNDFSEELYEYLEENEVVEDFGVPDYVTLGIRDGVDVSWHIYDSDWERQWPRAADYDEEAQEESGGFPIRADVKDVFNYMGADAPIGIATPVSRGILGTSGNDVIDLAYKAKAKPFGYLNVTAGLEPPYYFGFVFPAFEEVRLIHSDIGSKTLDSVFYRHITQHLDLYLEMGPSACDPNCLYCQLLMKWENMDYGDGQKWLDDAESDPDNDPCDPDDDMGADSPWGKAGGGATGGS